jgi:alpha-galactosidase
MGFTITFIGAGSIDFTRGLVRDILSVPELRGVDLAFTDINEDNLRMVTTLCRKDLEANGCPARIRATTNRREALRGARYVICVVRIGGLDAFTLDVDIPLRYGVDQAIGDTLCAGGIMYAQRGIAALLEFCRDIRDVCEPGALLLNYANPMAMMCWAACRYGGVRCVGLCHGVQNGHGEITEVIRLLVNGGRPPGGPGGRPVVKADVQVSCAGINHQSWFYEVRHAGEDWSGRLLDGFLQHPVFSRTEKVRIDVLRRFGLYSTESNGHLSEYLAWYRKRPGDIASWIDTSDWINGETGGALRECLESRDWFVTDYPRWLQDPALPYGQEHRSEEHGSFIIEALETGRPYRGHFNRPNGSTITNLPPDAVVEAPGYVDRHGISTPPVGELPPGCAAVCSQSIGVQRLAVQAAVSGNDTLLRQAMLMDPLVGAVCTPPEVWQMTDELLVAQRAWLPQYAAAVSAAQARLDEGPLVPTREGYRGAVRLPVRTVEQLRSDRGSLFGAE